VAGASQQAGESFARRPLTEARSRMTLGKSSLYRGKADVAADRFQRARSLYTEHRDPDDPDTLTSMYNLGSSYAFLGRHEDTLKACIADPARVQPSRPLRPGFSSLAWVLCTGAALRRPSVPHPTRRREGCFSPAVGLTPKLLGAARRDPAGRGPAPSNLGVSPAGPRALRAPGREVDDPGERGRRRCPGAAPGHFWPSRAWQRDAPLWPSVGGGTPPGGLSV
jgi:hypothetical protein